MLSTSSRAHKKIIKRMLSDWFSATLQTTENAGVNVCYWLITGVLVLPILAQAIYTYMTESDP